ncbi:MAG: hypothetical protein WCQ87_05450 [Parabacteroides sp.]
MNSKLLFFLLLIVCILPTAAAASNVDNQSVLDSVTDSNITINTTNETETVISSSDVDTTSSSNSFDEGKEMVKDAIKETPDDWADSALSETWGVTLGNLSDEVNATPTAKMINGIAAAEQHPKTIQWVQDEQKSDYTTYIICGLILLVWTAGYFFLQKFRPEQAGEITEFFSGAKHFLGFSLYYKTLLLLIILPAGLPFILDYSMELEQAWSSGIMANSLEYISFSTENIPLYFYQAISYTLSGPFFLARVNFINIVYAKVLILAILIAIPWQFIRYLGFGILLFFETILFMRPIVLLINAKTVQHVASMSAAQAIIAAPAYYGTMTIVTVVVVAIGTLWPFVYIIYKLWTSKSGRFTRRTARRF